MISLTPEYEYSYPKHQVCLNEKFWKPVFQPFIALLILIFPNVRPEFRPFGRSLERSAGISNVQPESRAFGRNLERSARISNVRPKFRTFNRNSERWKPVFGLVTALLIFFPNSRWLMHCRFPINAIHSLCQKNWFNETCLSPV